MSAGSPPSNPEHAKPEASALATAVALVAEATALASPRSLALAVTTMLAVLPPSVAVAVPVALALPPVMARASQVASEEPVGLASKTTRSGCSSTP